MTGADFGFPSRRGALCLGLITPNNIDVVIFAQTIHVTDLQSTHQALAMILACSAGPAPSNLGLRQSVCTALLEFRSKGPGMLILVISTTSKWES